MPTDAPIVMHDSGGAAWNHSGPIQAFTKPPAAAGFTVYNAGGRATTLADSNGGLRFSMTNGTTGYDCRVAVKAIAAAPYTWTAFLKPLAYADTQLFGLSLRQSSDGRIETFELSSTATLANAAFTFHNATANNTSTSPTYTQNTTGGIGPHIAFQISGGLWMQVQDDNTNRIYRISTDGLNWLTLRSVTRTTFLTPDEYGVCIFNSTAGNATMSCLYPSLG